VSGNQQATELAGLRALVTGAAKRVGRAIALELGRHGARVGVHYHRSRAEAEATCQEIQGFGTDAHCLQADLSDRDAARMLVDEALSVLGGLDLLVVSAAGYERVEFDDVSDAAWDRLIELNLTSPFVLARRAAPALRERGGSIVLVTCSTATTPIKNHLPYVVAKGGLRQLMRTLALELAPRIRVNAVAPGTVLPPDDMSDATRDRLEASIPLQRIGHADDVARSVLFLVQSPFITGHEVLVDGGRAVAKVERFG